MLNYTTLHLYADWAPEREAMLAAVLGETKLYASWQESCPLSELITDRRPIADLRFEARSAGARALVVADVLPARLPAGTLVVTPVPAGISLACSADGLELGESEIWPAGESLDCRWAAIRPPAVFVICTETFEKHLRMILHLAYRGQWCDIPTVGLVSAPEESLVAAPLWKVLLGVAWHSYRGAL